MKPGVQRWIVEQWRESACEQIGPLFALSRAFEQVLTQLDQQMRQTMRLGMFGDGVSETDTTGIRFIVADIQTVERAQRMHERLCHAAILVPQHRDRPAPGLPSEFRGEAVNGDQRRERAGIEARSQPIGDGAVIGLMDLLPALSPRCLIQVDIARNDGAMAVCRAQGGVVEMPVGVDDQSRIPMQERGQTQARSEQASDRAGMHVDGDVLFEDSLGKSKLRERGRHSGRRVIAQQQRARGCA